MTTEELKTVAWNYAWQQASYLPPKLTMACAKYGVSWGETLTPLQDAFIAGVEYMVKNYDIKDKSK